ncbi:hypothetical protein [Deinococcus xinjiangensis]
MQSIARFIQDHPYLAFYTILALFFLLVLGELRHAVEKRTLQRAWRQSVPPQSAAPLQPNAAPIPPAPPRKGSVSSTLAAVLGVGALLYVVPLLLQQQGQTVAGPIQSVLTSGTYRGEAAGALGNGEVVLSLNTQTVPPQAVLQTPLGSYSFEGQVTPESSGVFLSGELVGQSGVNWGKINAHITPMQVTGSVGRGPAQWALDLRR